MNTWVEHDTPEAARRTSPAAQALPSKHKSTSLHWLPQPGKGVPMRGGRNKAGLGMGREGQAKGVQQ